MKIEVLWYDMLWWLVNTGILGNVLPVASASIIFGCVTSLRILISLKGKEEFYKLVMQFILLLDTIKC